MITTTTSFPRILDVARHFHVPATTYNKWARPKATFELPQHPGVEAWCFNPDCASFANQSTGGWSEIHERYTGRNPNFDLVKAVVGSPRHTRLAFMREKDPTTGFHYRFIGVYHLNVKASQSQAECLWKRTAQQFAD